MNQEEIDRAVEVCKRNLSRFNDSPPDVQTLNGVLNNLNETYTAILSNTNSIDERLRNLEEGKNESHTRTESIAPKKIKKRKVARGNKVQRYSDDGKELIKTYPNIAEALRDDTIQQASENGLKKSIERNLVYKNFRWTFLPRDQPDETIQKLTETNTAITSAKKGFVAMLDLDQTSIVKVFPDQKRAAENRKFANGAAISKAMKQGTQSGGHYFKLWYDCSKNLQQEYLERDTLPEAISIGKAKGVIRIDENGIEKRYHSVEQVKNDMNMSRRRLYEAIKHEYFCKKYYWKFDQ